MATILIIDDEAGIRQFLSVILSREGHEVIEATTGVEGLDTFTARSPDLVLCDVILPDLHGLAVLQQIKQQNPAMPVVVITGNASTEVAIRAMALGASDYLVKPISLAQTVRVVRNILESLEPQAQEDRGPAQPLSGSPQLIGQTAGMYEVFKLIGRVAGQSSQVLVLGESGTGKELVARALHAHGPRQEQPFVAINCAAIPESLLESELFGHEKGAFTGADRKRPGKFELAQNGTLFLDEIGDMSPTVQAKLLRVLQDQEFYRLGGDASVRTAARVVAATNRDLRAEVAAGRFREDLYYRLAGVIIRLPPLRERREDIPLLTKHFLRESARALGRPVRDISPAALDILCCYDWPGNVRELANVVHQAVLLTPGSVLMPNQLAGQLPDPQRPDAAWGSELFDPDAVSKHVSARMDEGGREILPAMLAEFERVVIRAGVEHCRGNVSLAASHLGIHRVTLKAKLDAARTEVVR